jgi:hypothetical protein
MQLEIERQLWSLRVSQNANFGTQTGRTLTSPRNILEIRTSSYGQDASCVQHEKWVGDVVVYEAASWNVGADAGTCAENKHKVVAVLHSAHYEQKKIAESQALVLGLLSMIH